MAAFYAQTASIQNYSTTLDSNVESINLANDKFKRGFQGVVETILGTDFSRVTEKVTQGFSDIVGVLTNYSGKLDDVSVDINFAADKTMASFQKFASGILGSDFKRSSDTVVSGFQGMIDKINDYSVALDGVPAFEQTIDFSQDPAMKGFQGVAFEILGSEFKRTTDEMMSDFMETVDGIKAYGTQLDGIIKQPMTQWEQYMESFKLTGVEAFSSFAQSLTQAFATIRTQFANTIVGMIAGTATFKDFLTSIWQSVLSIFIQMLLQMGARYLATQLFLSSVDAARNQESVIALTAVESAKTVVTAEAEAARTAISFLATKAALAGAAASIAAIGAAGGAAMAVMEAVVVVTAGVLLAIAAALTASIYGAPLAPGYYAAAAEVSIAGSAAVLGGSASIAAAMTTAGGTIAGLLATPFAEGGLVTSPTLAMIGEAGPEIVAPFSDVERMLGSSDEGEQSITIMLDGRVLAKSTAKHLPKIIRMQGVPI